MSAAYASLHHSISVHFGISGSGYLKTRPNRSRPLLLPEDWTDYYNSVLYGSSVTNIQKLQRVQNSFARAVIRFRRSEHITSVLAKMHWLPIQYRIQFKLALLTFKVMTTQTPDYLTELVRRYEPTRQLRSCSRNLLEQNRVKLQFTNCAFRHSAPIVWNSLPQTVISDLTVSLHTFKSRLRTELYSRAFRQ